MATDKTKDSCEIESGANPILPGRGCNRCTLCCKVLSIKEIDKPQGSWCENCEIGVGCKIYSTRPKECSTFYCGYLTWPVLGDHWFPAKSKMVIVAELEGTRIAIHVDPGSPDVWRREPYFSEIREWSELAAAEMHQVVVCIGKRAIVILPDRGVDLGVIGEDERIITVERRTPGGVKLDAVKMKANDPRIAGLTPGKVVHNPKS